MKTEEFMNQKLVDCDLYDLARAMVIKQKENKKTEKALEKIPTITEKASERKFCPYCDTGILHQHIVTVDKGMTDYILSLEKEVKEEKFWTLADNVFDEGGQKVYKERVVKEFVQKVKEDVKETFKEGMEEAIKDPCLTPLDDKEVIDIINKRIGGELE